jgi:hypothetical protein
MRKSDLKKLILESMQELKEENSSTAVEVEEFTSRVKQGIGIISQAIKDANASSSVTAILNAGYNFGLIDVILDDLIAEVER